MKKNLSLLGIILMAIVLFTGCQKSDDISVSPNDENVTQLIDYEEAQQILNAELVKIDANKSNNSAQILKSTEEYNCDLFRLVLDYDDDPCVPLVYFDEYSKKNIDDNNPNIKFLAQAWFYYDGKWSLMSSYLAGGEITAGEKLGHWYLTYYHYSNSAAQILIYKYIDGQQPVYSGISVGVGFTVRNAPKCPYN